LGILKNILCKKEAVAKGQLFLSFNRKPACRRFKQPQGGPSIKTSLWLISSHLQGIV